MTWIKKLIFATRFPFTSVTVIPVMAVVSYLIMKGSVFSWPTAVIIITGTILAHLGANTLNDYSDWDDSDRINTEAGPFNGGSRSLMEKIMQRRDFLILSIVLYFLTVLLLYVLYLKEGYYVLLLGFAGIMCGILYSAKPFSFQKRGLGEILIFLAFGPLLTLGTAYALGAGNPGFFVLGFPFGFLTLNIIFINEFPDFEADRLVDKKTWVVRLGKKNASLLYPLIHSLFYLSVLFLYSVKIIGILTLMSALPLLLFSLFHLNVFFKGKTTSAQKSMIQFQFLSGVLLSLSFILSSALMQYGQ